MWPGPRITLFRIVRLISPSSCSLFDETLGWNSKGGVKLPNHGKGQWASAIQHLIDSVQPSDGRLQVFRRQVALVHDELDGFDGIGKLHYVDALNPFMVPPVYVGKRTAGTDP